MTDFAYLETPFGALLLVGEGGRLQRIELPRRGESAQPAAGWRESPDRMREALGQLAEYFDGERRVFELELDPRGTDFQRRVWRALVEIPFGVTRSYGELAAGIGRPTASRAVGAANGRNPLPIVVPCHRVVGADGTLTGYAGGLEIKRWLLRHEGVSVPDVVEQAGLF